MSQGHTTHEILSMSNSLVFANVGPRFRWRDFYNATKETPRYLTKMVAQAVSRTPVASTLGAGELLVERSRHHSKRPTRHAGAAWTRNAGPTDETLDLDTAWWVCPMNALSRELRRAQLPPFLVQDDYGQILEWSGVWLHRLLPSTSAGFKGYDNAVSRTGLEKRKSVRYTRVSRVPHPTMEETNTVCVVANQSPKEGSRLVEVVVKSGAEEVAASPSSVSVG